MFFLCFVLACFLSFPRALWHLILRWCHSACRWLTKDARDKSHSLSNFISPMLWASPGQAPTCWVTPCRCRCQMLFLCGRYCLNFVSHCPCGIRDFRLALKKIFFKWEGKETTVADEMTAKVQKPSVAFTVCGVDCAQNRRHMICLVILHVADLVCSPRGRSTSCSRFLSITNAEMRTIKSEKSGGEAIVASAPHWATRNGMATNFMCFLPHTFTRPRCNQLAPK